MQNLENKKRHIPGTRDLAMQIKQISDDITGIDVEIRQCQDRIRAIIVDVRSSSPRSRILSELNQATEDRNAIKSERKNYFSLVETAKASIEKLRKERASSDVGFTSIEKINRAIEDLEMKLIATSITPKEEIGIANSLLNLRLQKDKLGLMEHNTALVENLEASLKEYKPKIAHLSQQLSEKNAIIDSLKAELEKLAESGKNKSPEVVKLEDKITALKAQKNDCFAQRNSKKERIRSLEEDFAKLESERHVQKQLEEEKDIIRKAIASLKFEKDVILNEQESYSPGVFDSLIFTVKKLKDSGTFSLDIGLVTHLMKYDIKIPSSMSSLDRTVEALQQKKDECCTTLKQKSARFGSAISDINSKIEEENAKLNSLPPTNFDVLKRTGFRRDFRNKV